MQAGLFQGACYYAPDTGSQQLVAQIGGRQFTFTPSVNGGSVAVNEISIPGNFNPPLIPQAWLTQAERWVIFQDGQSIPLFYDGNTLRRSVPTTTLLGTSDGTMFTTPALGAIVAVNLTPPYAGQLNAVTVVTEFDTATPPNIIATSNYLVTDGGTQLSYTAVLKNVGDVAGTVHNPNAQLVVQPSNLGLFTTTTFGYIGQSTTMARTGTLSSPLPSYVVVGSMVTIAGDGSRLICGASTPSPQPDGITSHAALQIQPDLDVQYERTTDDFAGQQPAEPDRRHLAQWFHCTCCGGKHHPASAVDGGLHSFRSGHGVH